MFILVDACIHNVLTDNRKINRNLRFDRNLRRERCSIVHGSVCLSDEAARLTCKYVSASLFIYVMVSKVRATPDVHVHVIN